MFISTFHFDVGILDIVLNFPGYHRWRFIDVLRNILKIIVSLAWAVILPLFYVHSFKDAPKQIIDVLSFLKKIDGVPALYIMAVAVYLLPNLLAAVLFLFPLLRRWIENSDWHIIRFLLWWSQVFLLTWYFLSWIFLHDFCYILLGVDIADDSLLWFNLVIDAGKWLDHPNAWDKNTVQYPKSFFLVIVCHMIKPSMKPRAWSS